MALLIGVRNAGKIHGKDASELTLNDKISAGGAGALEAVTLGLVDAKTAIKASNKVADFLTGNKELDKGNFAESSVLKYSQDKIKEQEKRAE